MLWEGLEGIWRHPGGFREALGGIREALGGSWVAFGGSGTPWDPPWDHPREMTGEVKVKCLSGGATRGPSQQDQQSPDLLTGTP